ncbi:MAG: hypothetical protein HGB17_17580, partial [Syntrophobacteraceae bacterium]|nr:hypothetical protein [Syntrophobacteraceae bacterium]
VNLASADTLILGAEEGDYAGICLLGADLDADGVGDVLVTAMGAADVAGAWIERFHEQP